ncbi:type II toxin-antitoxin system Phd/YefM family antitoxin [Actinokineospora sp.]|uniref:type II toxin-antitoxin system Phd/YefM family antitoxin n=1 Tax=Actinokineospora sp. TaxID=1872133 RepID=UPI003D6A04AE
MGGGFWDDTADNLCGFLYSFVMAVLKHAREITVTEASRRGVAGLVADAEHGEALVVTRHHRRVAALVSVDRLAEIEDAAEDLRDLALVLARSATDSGRRTSFDNVLAAFGHTRESLTAIEDDD